MGEEVGEAFIGAALCAEALATMLWVGPRAYMHDSWRSFDALIALLTVVCSVFFLLRRTAVGDEERIVEDIDVPFLALRFALQPLRMVTTATMVVRAHRLHQAVRPTLDEALPLMDPRRHVPSFSPLLSRRVVEELQSLLPTSLRFLEWELAYSPRVHGTSMRTFYRRQLGPNILIVRDSGGGIFGGFAPEAWRPAKGSYGLGESFVFTVHGDAVATHDNSAGGSVKAARATKNATDDAEVEAVVEAGANAGAEADAEPGNEAEAPLASSLSSPPEEPGLDVFWGVAERGRVLQWSDARMLGLGRALVVFEDFIRGTSQECETFGSVPLSSCNAGADFLISHFECWHVGCCPAG
eukprot:NODE_930_length_1307_cov_180.139776.p1 GENE.NODE_930_length_1307_cov_180.139776~~NODE_930_length_1307_cov_180.139776.p1  ORF type:complete len:354 (-),score=106.21 NODE_930_length_1307_cov_180.139776:228-1289(-)